MAGDGGLRRMEALIFDAAPFLTLQPNFVKPNFFSRVTGHGWPLIWQA